MLRRLIIAAVIALTGLALQATPARAQQSFTVNLGAFMPKAEDARVAGDVLVVNRQYLLFDFSDFNDFTFGGDWAMGLGEFFEVGAGLGYYQSTVPAVYDQWVNDDGSEIYQELKLRVVPMTAVVRILPLGSRRAFQPYVGGGLGVYYWRYAETGEFVDFRDNSIFRASFVDSGTTVGPVAVFGVRGRVSPAFTIGTEFRLQWAEGSLSQDFLSDKIDLGGLSVLGTFTYRF